MSQAVALSSSTQQLNDNVATASSATLASYAPKSQLLGFVVVLLGWQITLLMALINGFVGLGGYAVIHLTGCLALIAWLIWRRSAGEVVSHYTTFLQIVVWSAVAGPFGAFVAFALAFRVAGTATPFVIDPEAETSPGDGPELEQVDVHLALRDRRIRLEGAHRVSPMMDVLAEGSNSEKLAALGVIYRRYDARLGAVLKRALQDSDTSIRVLAATVTAKLNSTFSRKIGDCQAATSAAPDLAESWRNVAAARLAYAESGLLQASRARQEVEAALADFARAKAIDPLDPDTNSGLNKAQRHLAAWGD